MGYHVQQDKDPTEYIPKVFFNATGGEPWGGCHVSELTGMDVVSILEFCQSEAWRQGWNDSVQGRVCTNVKGPFHPELLGGFPYQEWIRNYHRGVAERDAERQPG